MEDAVEDVLAEARLAVKVGETALKAAEGAATFSLLLVVNAWSLALVFTTGVVLVAFRQAFLAMIPFMLTNAKPIVWIINHLCLLALNIVIDAFIVAMDVVIGVVDAFPGVNVREVSFVHIPEVTYADFELTLRECAMTCSKVDSIPTMWGFAVAPELSRAACPYFRAIYPIAWLRPVSDAFVGVATFNPDPDTNNCAAHGEFVGVQAPVALCTGLAGGFVVLEVLLPMLVAGLLLLSFGGTIKSAVGDAAYAGEQAAEVTSKLLIQISGAVGTLFRRVAR